MLTLNLRGAEHDGLGWDTQKRVDEWLQAKIVVHERGDNSDFRETEPHHDELGSGIHEQANLVSGFEAELQEAVGDTVDGFFDLRNGVGVSWLRLVQFREKYSANKTRAAKRWKLGASKHFSYSQNNFLDRVPAARTGARYASLYRIM